MIKEIRIGMDEILSFYPEEYSVMFILKYKGFPYEITTDIHAPLKPKAGLKYYEFHDHKTGEIVVQWEETP